VHLVIGPVGAGKSTFALALAQEHAALRLTLDQWLVQLFSPDRPEGGVMEWYVARAARCVERIWSVAQGVTDLGHDVVLEIGLLQRHERERFYQRVTDAGLQLTIHVLDAARDVRRERVNERNHAQGATFSMVVPPAIFELASDLWEPPDESECLGRQVVFLRTDGD
jgi:predicted kinase